MHLLMGVAFLFGGLLSTAFGAIAIRNPNWAVPDTKYNRRSLLIFGLIGISTGPVIALLGAYILVALSLGEKMTIYTTLPTPRRLRMVEVPIGVRMGCLCAASWGEVL